MLIYVNLYIFITNLVFSLIFSVACRLPGPSGVDCCGTHMGWSRVGGWWRGNGGDSGAESGNGWGFREPGSGNWGAGNGVRETGIRESQISGIRGIRKRKRFRNWRVCTNVHSGTEFGGIHPRKPPGNPPGNPKKTPELANNYRFRSLAGSLAPEL